MAKAITLTTLPNELLDAICACLPQSSRYALALTCKATKSSATAALYRTYTNHSHPAEAPFHLFLRTICESPELGALVKKLDIRGWRSEHEVAAGEPWRPMVKEPVKKVERSTYPGTEFVLTDFALAKMMGRFSTTATGYFDLFLQTAVNIGLVAMPASTDRIPTLKMTGPTEDTLTADADLIRQLKHGVEDSHFVLLVAQLPNLEKLLIDGLTPYAILDWHHFLSRVGTALQSLKVLDLWGSRVQSDHKVVKTTLQIVDILPSLEFLQLSDMDAQEFGYTVKDRLPSKKLRKLSLNDSAVSHRLFKKITDGQHLESFTIFSAHFPMVSDPVDSSSEQVVACLESSKHSLKTLDYFTIQPFEHFAAREYTNLQHLTIPFPGHIYFWRTNESLEVITDRLRRSFPSSLESVTFSPLLDVKTARSLIKAVTTLKIRGSSPRLDVLTMNFIPNEGLERIEFPPISLHELRASIGRKLTLMVASAKLELRFEERCRQDFMVQPPADG